LPVDVITAFIGTAQLSSSKPITMAYQAPGLLRISSLSGAQLTSASYAPACSLVNGIVTALKGTGACDIGVTSGGTAAYAPVTSHFPIYLTIGQDGIIAKAYPISTKLGQNVNLFNESTFGESLTFSTKSKYCALNDNVLKPLRKGSCHVQITGASRKDLFKGAKNTIKVLIK
jgi:hypothetical protein